MNRICSLIALAFSFVVLSVQAQEDSSQHVYTTTISDPITPILAGKNNFFAYNGSVICLKTFGKKFGIQVFSGDNLNETERVEYTDFEPLFAPEQYIRSGSKIYFFYSVWDRENVLEQLYVRIFDLETLSFPEAGRKILDTKGKVRGGNGNKFNIQRSRDRTLFLVKYKKTLDERETPYDIYGSAILSDDLEVLSKEEIEMPLTRDEMRVLDYQLSSQGNLYFLYATSTGLSVSLIENGELQTRESEEDDMDEDTMASEFIKGFSWLESANNNLYLMGYYGYETYYAVQGVFWMKIDESGDIGELKKIEDKELDRFRLERVVSENDGNFVIFGHELKRTFDGVSTDIQEALKHISGALQTRYVFTKVNHTDSIEWSTILSWTPVSENDYRDIYIKEFFLTIIANEYYLFRVNMNLQKDKKHKRFLGVATVNYDTGKKCEYTLFDLNEVNGLQVKELNVREMIVLSESEFAIPFFDKQKRYRMMRLKLNLEDCE